MQLTALLLGALVLLACQSADAQTTQPAPTVPPYAPSTRPAIPPGFHALRDLSYVTTPNPSTHQRLDLFLPDSPPDHPLPTIVYVHGGGWRKGSKDNVNCLRLLPKGFAVASVEYRFTPEGPFPNCIHDVKAAVRFLRAHAAQYHLDPDRFGAIGGSAGGHLVALLGTTAGNKQLDGDLGYNDQRSDVQAVVDFFGPHDLRILPAGPDLTPLLGGTPAEKPDVAALASPLLFVSPNSAPMLLIHGDKDDVVPVEQTHLLHHALTKAGIESTEIIIGNTGHATPDFSRPEILAAIDAFLTRHLKPTTP